MVETDSEGRVRFTRGTVDRDPNGPVLRPNQGPVGLRAPNGFIWAHTVREFLYIPRVPSVPNYVTTWSRSMLKTLGENYDEIESYLWEDPLVPPRVLRPWPVLKLPLDHPAQPDPPLGAVDEGCEWEHSDFMCYTIRPDRADDAPKDSKRKVLPGYAQVVPRRCPTNPSQECSGRLVFKNTPDSGESEECHYVWCEHFKARLQGKGWLEKERMIADAVTSMPMDGIVADDNGIQIVKRHIDLIQGVRPGMSTVDNGAGQDGSAPSSSAKKPTSEAPVGTAKASSGEDGQKKEGVASDEALPVDAMDLDADSSPKTDEKLASDVDRFSLKDIPKLEEFIPDALLPDILLVHDPDRATKHKQPEDEPVKYRRVIYRLPNDATPEATSTPTEARVAHLHLRSEHRLGSGHHSDVYSAPLTLPPPLSAHSRTGQVAVAAKLAFARCTAHTLLHNEARAYARIPKHAQEEYCGFNVVPPCRFPVPVGPIVPKCYGFYLPVGADGEVAWREEDGARHSRCDEDEPCRVDWLSPILLMEQCGEPVEPEKFTIDQRTECFSLVLRLHELRITQGSFYVRNIMIQPGPLSRPPVRRSFDTPSFRIIDFGRARCLGLLLAGAKDKEQRGRVLSEFRMALGEEERQARQQLLIEECEF